MSTDQNAGFMRLVLNCRRGPPGMAGSSESGTYPDAAATLEGPYKVDKPWLLWNSTMRWLNALLKKKMRPALMLRLLAPSQASAWAAESVGSSQPDDWK